MVGVWWLLIGCIEIPSVPTVSDCAAYEFEGVDSSYEERTVSLVPDQPAWLPDQVLLTINSGGCAALAECNDANRDVFVLELWQDKGYPWNAYQVLGYGQDRVLSSFWGFEADDDCEPVVEEFEAADGTPFLQYQLWFEYHTGPQDALYEDVTVMKGVMFTTPEDALAEVWVPSWEAPINYVYR